MDYKILENHTVIVTTMFHGIELSAMARAGHDKFNPEFGKALARVRLERKIARLKEERIVATRKIYMKMIESDKYDNKAILLSFNALGKKLDRATWYRLRQVAIERAIKAMDPATCEGSTEKEIISSARDKAI